MKRKDYHGNIYDTDDPTSGPYISLFGAYGHPDRAAFETIKNTPYTITDGREVMTITPLEAFTMINDERRKKTDFNGYLSAARLAYQVIEQSKNDFARAEEEGKATEETQNGAENMKHTETAEYFEDLKSAYTQSRAVYEELANAQAAENEKYRLTQQDHAAGKISEREYTIALANHINAEDTIKHNFEAARAAFAESATATRAELAAFLANKYEMDGGDIDETALKLLNAGICNAADLAKLAETFKSNATMKRIIAKHAAELEKNAAPDSDEQKAARALGYHLTHTNDGTAELEAFDSLVNWAGRGIDDKGDYTTRVFDRHFTDAYETVINGIREI